MKIRTGFVSNSSSSSFCIYGAFFRSCEEAAEALGLDEVPESPWDILVPEGLRLWNVGERYDPEIFIGRCWATIKDDETGKEFKESVKKVFKDAGGKDIYCSTHEEAWYNG